MYTSYNLFKFLHVAAAMVWVGGVAALMLLPARMARTGDQAALAAFGRGSEFYGSRVVGPSAVVALLAGIAMVVVGDLEFSELWIAYGFLGLVVSMGLGGGVLSRIGHQLAELAAAERPDGQRMAQLQQRMRILSLVNLILLLSVVWAMVFKPTL